MTCRHNPHDPACTSYGSRLADAEDFITARAEAEGKRSPAPATPDAERFAILKAEEVGSHLVLKVRYPNCSKCAFEGTKVMVFLNMRALWAMRWRVIDPHFRSEVGEKLNREKAPSPDARFPATAEGWNDAIAYAGGKS
jgi:hypothetical protein